MSDQIEKWRCIPGDWGHFYEVSNLGRVKSMPRTVNGWKKPVTRKEQLIKPTIHKKSGFLCFRAWSNGKYKVFFLHRVVASTFVRNPSKKTFDIVGFKDGDINNCASKNLYWTSAGELLKIRNAQKLEHIA